MKKKNFSPLWLIPAVVIIALILWCIYFPLTMFAGLDKDVELLSATVLVDEVPETPAIAFTTDDPQQLAQIMKELRKPRCRFFGWFSYITHNDDPLLHLIVTGKEGDKNASLSLCTDSDGFVYIQDNNISLRAKDSGLYDYLTQLVEEAAEQTTGETADLLSSCSHTPGVYIKSEWKESDKFDPSAYCYYDVQWDYVRCADCSTPYSYETAEEAFALHRKEVAYDENGAAEGFTCTECSYCG